LTKSRVALVWRNCGKRRSDLRFATLVTMTGMMAMRLMKCFAATAAFLMLSAIGASAEEGTKLDCADMDMQFKAPGFEITCKDFSDPSAVSNAGRLRAERLYAFSESQEQFIVAWDVRALGSIYLKRRGMEEDMHDFFPDEKLDEWKVTAPVEGYEFAQYVNRRSGSSEEECIAFRRQMTRRNGGAGDSGFGRIVLGFGCTTRERSVLIESLKQLDAPGG
jgi:hypothetical protein